MGAGTPNGGGSSKIGRGFLPLGTFDLKQRCAEWSPYDIKVPWERFECIGSDCCLIALAVIWCPKVSILQALLQVERAYWQTGTWHACAIFSPNQLQRKLRPTADSKDFIGCVNHSVHLISYTMLQKMLTPKPTPHLTLTLTSEIALKRKLPFRR